MDLFTVPPPSLSSLHKPTLFISLSLSLLLFCLALIYFNFEPLLLWLSLSLLIGPFAPPSLTAGDIRVGVGPQLEEIPAAQIEFTEKPSRKSVKSTRKASEETEGNSNAIDLSRFDLPKRRSSRSSIEAVVEAKPEEWGEADDEMLKKLMGKHPVGKPGRWEAISEGFKGRYKVETVIAKAKHIGEKKGGDQNSYTKFLKDREKRHVEEEDGTKESGWSATEDGKIPRRDVMAKYIRHLDPEKTRFQPWYRREKLSRGLKV
ncbi:transcription factor MAMYB-like [Salvia splendens]|uniref:transcription factor MAMYB-like n=1 Tax=Salvia splendens TaxID=180675 RepID=UPI001C26E1C5|nr:transcription factor MAMYB-like [Salvia splendens]